MNNNIDCEVIRDLLPLFCDNVVSEKTKSVINIHLKECEKCKGEYEKLLADITVDNKNTNTQKKFISTMKKQKNKTRIKILASVCIIFVLLLGGFFVDHYWGDNIYAAFVFKDSDVIEVNKTTYKTPKDDYKAFERYMINQGWTFNDQLGTLYVYENKDSFAYCEEDFRRYYALYTVEYVEKIKPSSELVDLYAKNIYKSFFKDGKITYSNGEEYSNWSVAWNNTDKAKINSVYLVVENDSNEIFSKPLKIATNVDIHGWKNSVNAPNTFSAECEKGDNIKAYIKLYDNNGVEYKVCLDETEWNLNNPNDSSNDIIITDANSEYSYWDYREKSYYAP